MVEYMEGAYGRRVDGRREPFRPRGPRSAAARRRERADVVRACERMSVDPSFVKLRRRFALQSAVLVSGFLISYLAYLLLSAYAREFMSMTVIEPINVALLMGIGQFLLAFALAWAFGRFSARAIDPLAERIRDRAREEECMSGRVIR